MDARDYSQIMERVYGEEYTDLTEAQVMEAETRLDNLLANIPEGQGPEDYPRDLLALMEWARQVEESAKLALLGFFKTQVGGFDC